MPDFDLGLVLGSDGEDAPKIESIEKTSTSGLVDTYTITLEDGSEYTFDVTNGEDGSSVSVTQVLSSGTKLATITVDGTSTDLYCNSGGSADIVTSWESTLSDTKVPSEKLTKNSLDDKISKSNTTGLVKNDGTIDTTTKLTASDIVDNLTSSDATKVLSAKQGKVLKESLPKQITLTSSDYNPDVGDTITLTCTVKDAFGNPVSGYTCQLYKDGVSMGSSYSSITNNNGVATFSNIPCSTGGLTAYSVDAANCTIAIGLALHEEIEGIETDMLS